MLTHILARLQASLILVEDVILASALIAEEIDSFLQIGNFDGRQTQQDLRCLFKATKRQTF